MSPNGFGSSLNSIFVDDSVNSGVVSLETYDEYGFRNKYFRFDRSNGLPFYGINLVNDETGRGVEKKIWTLNHGDIPRKLMLVNHEFINFNDGKPIGYTQMRYDNHDGQDEVVLADFNKNLAVADGKKWYVLPSGEIFGEYTLSGLIEDINNGKMADGRHSEKDLQTVSQTFKTPLGGWII